MTILILVTWASFAVFVLAVAGRSIRLLRLPPHVRWEIYPVAHEKGRAHYGGSYMEVPDWWLKKRETSVLGELKFMVPEILLLAGVRHKNPSHWLRSFPFHFGLYLLVGATALLVGGGIATALGAAPGVFLGNLTAALAYVGFGLGLLGALLLLLRRLLNGEYREYTTPMDFANLVLFIAAFAVALGAQVSADRDFALMRGFFAGLFGGGTFEIPALLKVQIVMLSVLAAYVPLTHMSHFFTKWFMYHDIRWADAPLVAGGRMEKRIVAALGYRPTWSAKHIAGDGKKTWADIVTSRGFEEESK
ncbi:MAG: hypothetical protein MUE73_17800 [Planctomycetes bacterium]|nr:hypothetical protein [Planctomycetota bacterium]